MNLKASLEQIIIDAEAADLLERLDKFKSHVRENIPSEILILPSGEYNYSNRYGAMLTQATALTCTLRTFLE
ncbi:MAG: hypothetical protein ACWGQW_05085 [bacterium]